MLAVPLLLLLICWILSLLANGYNYKCPASQTMDTHVICRMFQSTNIKNKIPHDFSDNNYCGWKYTESLIGCQSDSNEEIDLIVIECADGINGTLNWEYPWPSHLKELDLEQSFSSVSNLYGEWNWPSIQSLHSLVELDLEGNEFSSFISNTDWNIIASMSMLTDFTLVNNNFQTNFSEIRIDVVSKIITMGLSENNLYGTMDLQTDGFFSKFPDLEFFWIDNNNIYGYFENMDVISSRYLPNLKQFKLGTNHYSGEISLSPDLSLSPLLTHFEIYKNDFYGSVEWNVFANLNNLKVIDIGGNFFSGSLSMSDSLSLSPSLAHIDIDYNDFQGQIDWNIFINLYNLIELHLNDNSFSGDIDWNIISDLHNNGHLDNINFRDNDFTGYADFSWINDDKLVYLDLDVDIPCNPIIYKCVNGIQTKRSNQDCHSRAECEATCVCSSGDDITINHVTPTNTTAINQQTSITPNVSIINYNDDEYFHPSTGVYVNHVSMILIGCIVLFSCVVCSMVIFIVHWKGKTMHEIFQQPVHRSVTSNSIPSARQTRQKIFSVSCTEFSIPPTIQSEAKPIRNSQRNHRRTLTPGYSQHIIALSGKTRRETTFDGPEGHEEDSDSDSDEFTVEKSTPSFGFLPTPAYSLDMDVMRGRAISVNSNHSPKHALAVPGTHNANIVVPIFSDDIDQNQQDNNQTQNIKTIALAIVGMLRIISTKSMIQDNEYIYK